MNVCVWHSVQTVYGRSFLLKRMSSSRLQRKHGTIFPNSRVLMSFDSEPGGKKNPATSSIKPRSCFLLIAHPTLNSALRGHCRTDSCGLRIRKCLLEEKAGSEQKTKTISLRKLGGVSFALGGYS